jgi:hypothetical protein
MLGVYAPEEFDETAPPAFTGPTIDAEPQTRETVNAEVSTPKKTRRQWLDELEHDIAVALASADPKLAIDEIISRSDVQKAEEVFTNGTKEKLTRMIREAIAATADAAEHV